jgi:hypothetical protein
VLGTLEAVGVVVLGPDDVRIMGGKECVDRPELSAVQRSDLVRLYLLASRGSAWIDADTIVLRSPPLEALYQENPRAALIGFGNWSKRFPSCLLLGRPCQQMGEIYEIAQRRSRNRKTRKRYTALGPAMLTKLWHGGQHNIIQLKRRPWLYSVAAGRLRWYAQRSEPNRVRAGFYMAHVCGYTMRDFREHTRDEVLGSDTLFAVLLRAAMGDDPQGLRP